MPINYEDNFSTQHLSLIQSSGTTDYEFNPENGDYIRLSFRNQVFYSDYVKTDEASAEIIGSNFGLDSDFIIYKDSSNNHYIKPNDLLDEKNFPSGRYNFRLDFLNDLNILNPDFSSLPFILRETSTSGLEVRLKIDNQTINSSNISNYKGLFDGVFGGTSDNVSNFNFVLLNHRDVEVGASDGVPIVNYTFDDQTAGFTDQSIILKLYTPSTFNNLNRVSIVKEVLLTQTIQVRYFSNIPMICDPTICILEFQNQFEKT